MTYEIVLLNAQQCELERKCAGDSETDISAAVAEFAESVVLYEGDTIKIVRKDETP